MKDSKSTIKITLLLIGISLLGGGVLTLSKPKEKEFPNTTAENLLHLPPSTLLLDARSDKKFKEGHIPQAKNLPVETFEASLPPLQHTIEQSKEIITYCSDSSCNDSLKLARKLNEKFPNKPLSIYKEGWEEWTLANYPVANP